MPYPLPPHIERFIKEHAPPTHKLVWMRCIQTAPPEEIERPPFMSALLMGRKPPIPHDLHLRLYDLDSDDDGWDVRLMETGHDISQKDVFSLLGHVEPGADRLPRPFLLINHNTCLFERVYEDVSVAGHKLQSEIRYKRSLSFWTPGTPSNRIAGLRHTLAGFYTSPLTPAKDRRRNLTLTALLGAWLGLLGLLGPGGLGQYLAEQTLLHPWLLTLWVPLGAVVVLITGSLLAVPGLLLSSALVYLGIRLMRAVMEPPRFKRAGKDYTFSEMVGWSNVTDWWSHCYVDQTYLYEDVIEMLHLHARQNPDEERGFVIGKVRGQGEKGRLADGPQAESPDAPGLESQSLTRL